MPASEERGAVCSKPGKVEKQVSCGDKAERFFKQAAEILSVDLEKPYSIEEVKLLPKSKVSVSDAVNKARAEKYSQNLS